MKIRRIVQKDSTGCGIACVAMLCGNTYSQVKAIATDFGFVPNNYGHSTESWQLRELLSHFGVKSDRGRRLSHWHSLNCFCIVGINYNKNSDKWHWVVYVPDESGGYILDPMGTIKTSERRDFNRMRPKSFVPVQQPNNSFKPTPHRGVGHVPALR